MQRGRLFLIGGATAVLIAAGFAYTRPDPLPVQTVKAGRGAVAETVTNTRAGTVKACRRARLAPPLGGQISKLPVKKGDAVRAGQILLELWNEDLKAQLTLAQRDARAAQSRSEEACIAADMARRDADRLAAVLARGLVAVDVADQAKGAAEGREAACRAATQNIKVAQARISQAMANMERTRLRAPFDGIVAEINGELGEFVTPSPLGVATPPAVDVVDTSCIYVTAPIDEVDAPRLRTDMPARVTLDAFRDRTFAARVRRVAPYVLDLEKQARTVEVEAVLEKTPDATLLPGYSADLEVVLDERTNVLRIPTRALLEGQRVYVFDPRSKTVALKKIKTGLRNWEYAEVRSGLQEGDQVVTTVDREGLADGVAAVVE
jgi:HlyD family secretion protein